MSATVVSTRIGSLDSYYIGIDAYDPDKLGLGPSFGQFTGVAEIDKFAGPLPYVLGRPMEASTAIPTMFPRPMRWANSGTKRINWVFMADNAAAAATRRIVAYEHNLITNVLKWQGFITLTYPAATNHTIRGLSFDYKLETTGTVGVSGTAVTGSGTGWQTDKCCVGNRIGFGSTDPTAITTWYEISAIGSDTGITLATSAGTITAGTAFVIEDLRIITQTTNATATNGGIQVTKGLRWENFSAAGTTIPAATTVDSIRAVYWLKDAATVTNTVGNGITLDDATSATSRMLWAGNGTTTQQLFKYNIRAALTLTSGADTSNFQFSTAVSATLTGTASQNDNLVGATTSHGPGSGVRCAYFTTTTRIYRTKELSTISTGDTTFITGGDVMTEVPPGGTSTNVASGAINSIDYLASVDKFVFAVSTAAWRDYLTQYRADGGQMDRIFGATIQQIAQGAASSDLAPFYTKNSIVYTFGDDNAGMCYALGINTAASGNFLFGLPLAADWEYASTTNQRLILPQMATPEADSLIQAFVNAVEVVGGRTGQNLGQPTEPFRVYYRTTGIDDNSGAWTLLDDTMIMSGATAGTHVQLMIEFRTIGMTGIPARILLVGVIFNQFTDDSHFEFSHAETVPASRIFAWRYKAAFGASVPDLKIRLYDATDPEAVTLLVTDDTATETSGTFERSADGTTWGAWTNSDKGNDTTYVRYTLTSLAGNPAIRCILTLA